MNKHIFKFIKSLLLDDFILIDNITSSFISIVYLKSEVYLTYQLLNGDIKLFLNGELYEFSLIFHANLLRNSLLLFLHNRNQFYFKYLDMQAYKKFLYAKLVDTQ